MGPRADFSGRARADATANQNQRSDWSGNSSGDALRYKVVSVPLRLGGEQARGSGNSREFKTDGENPNKILEKVQLSFFRGMEARHAVALTANNSLIGLHVPAACGRSKLNIPGTSGCSRATSR